MLHYFKILESAIKEQPVAYLSDNKQICDENNLHTFLVSLSKLHSIIDEISLLDSKQIFAKCSLDSAKGFDTTLHNILLLKILLC